MTTTERGTWGEKQALAFLKDKGYKLVARNYRSRFGEIDLIVSDNSFIVFVEVKLRKNSNFALAREFVSYKKQEKLRATANLWLSNMSRSEKYAKTNLQPRFDVIEIYAEDETAFQINHIENAF